MAEVHLPDVLCGVCRADPGRCSLLPAGAPRTALEMDSLSSVMAFERNAEALRVAALARAAAPTRSPAGARGGVAEALT